MALYRLHPGQERVRAERSRFNVVSCGRRFGKTILGVDLAIETALEGYPVGWFAPEYSLLREAWRELEEILAPVARFHQAERRITLPTGGSIKCWSFDRNPNAGRSYKYKRIIIDEAAHCRSLEATWTRAVRPTLTDFRGDGWFLSSPDGHNYFRELHQKGQDPGQPAWMSWTASSYHNPHLDPAEIDSARAELPDLVFRQEYLAEFVEDAAGALLPAWWVDRAAEPGIVATVEKLRAAGKGGRRRLAIDLGVGSGRDSTVILVGDHLGLLARHASDRTGLAEAASLAAKLSREWRVADEDLVYDAGGPGRDFGRHLENHRIAGVPYHGGAPSKGRYTNRRARSHWHLRRRLDPERPLPLAPDPRPGESVWDPPPGKSATVLQPPYALGDFLTPTLREELVGVRYAMDRDQIRLEDKDKFMERLGRSPNELDALAMLHSHGGDE